MKYLSSIYLFVTNPTQHEGILHIARQKIISNKALLVNADKSGLPQYIQSKPFMPKLWTPQGYSIHKASSKLSATDGTDNKNGSVDIKKESPTEVDTDMLSHEVSHTNGDTEMADSKEAVDSNKGGINSRVLASAAKLKRTLYDEEHQWLGDKVNSLPWLNFIGTISDGVVVCR